jgi:hypothetical protein
MKFTAESFALAYADRYRDLTGDDSEDTIVQEGELISITVFYDEFGRETLYLSHEYDRLVVRHKGVGLVDMPDTTSEYAMAVIVNGLTTALSE